MVAGPKPDTHVEFLFLCLSDWDSISHISTNTDEKKQND